jgi:hypothetical protein
MLLRCPTTHVIMVNNPPRAVPNHLYRSTNKQPISLFPAP